MKRRQFLQSAPCFAFLAANSLRWSSAQTTAGLKLSLAQWSLHRTFFGSSLNSGYVGLFEMLANDPRSVLQGEAHPLEFAAIARNEFDIDAIEYVNTFFYDRAEDNSYLDEMILRADDVGVRSTLIMCDRLGALGAAEAGQRQQAIENHRPWLDAASKLGCTAIRVNVNGDGTRDEMTQKIVESLTKLGELAQSQALSVLVENHGGLSSDGAWLANVMENVARDNVGTLPDFGNFKLTPNLSARSDDDPYYDRYQGVAELMPYARAVSAKSNDFDEQGDAILTDFERMLNIILAAGYQGYVGIEYEGGRLSEIEGIRATQVLLERLFAKLG